MRAAVETTPAARRALSLEPGRMLPLVREAVELETKAPDLAQRVFTVFGDDGALQTARTVPAEDVPRLISYPSEPVLLRHVARSLRPTRKRGNHFSRGSRPKWISPSGRPTHRNRRCARLTTGLRSDHRSWQLRSQPLQLSLHECNEELPQHCTECLMASHTRRQTASTCTISTAASVFDSRL
jgi:hypothetical protein